MEKTDYKITEFHNSEFGSIRMIEDGGRLLFSGIDVAFALGYAKPRNAINVHCKGALKRGVLTSGGVQPMIFIPEGDVYRLITKSRLKSAQNFEKWVFDEVLPTIRKHGAYMTEKTLEEAILNPDYLPPERIERLLDVVDDITLQAFLGRVLAVGLQVIVGNALLTNGALRPLRLGALISAHVDIL